MLVQIRRLLLATMPLMGAILLGGHLAAARTLEEDQLAAAALSTLLESARAVISANQERIDNPELGQDGLDGAGVLADALRRYQAVVGSAPPLDQTTQLGRLVRMEMDAIVEVMDANQPTLKAHGPRFKGFIPATFSRLVAESFNRRAGGEAEMKVTAPPDLVRNRRSRPDAWEQQVIADRFLSPDWPRDQPFSAIVEQNGHEMFRIAVPEYYSPSCLSCHGGPKGSVDMTGYPREGASNGDLGSVISIKLAH